MCCRLLLLLLLPTAVCFGDDNSASVRVAILVADAEKLYREGQPRQAVELYDKAAAKAFAEGATGRAFELSRTAAAVLQAAGEHADAGQRLRRLALSNAAHPDAAVTHHAAIVCLAQGASEDAAGGNAYAEAMAEFLDQWPEDTAAPEVAWWLVKWRVSSGEWQEAIDLLLPVSMEDPHHDEATRLLGRAVVGRLKQLRREGASAREVKKVVLLATSRLQPLITGTDNKWPSSWTNLQRGAALTLARMHMEYADSGPQYPYRLLTAAATGAPAAGEAWRAEALPLLVRASLEAGEPAKAIEWAGRLTKTSLSHSRELVAWLEPQAIATPDDQALGELLVLLSERLGGENVPEWLDRGHAAGLVSLGRNEEALRILASLVERRPKDAVVLELYAIALARQPSEEAQREALALWCGIEDRSPPGKPRWRQARLTRIELLRAIGERDEAQKLLRLTRALYPEPVDARLLERTRELDRVLK